MAAYTDAATNITFNTWGVEEAIDDDGYPVQGTYYFGMALPPDALKNNATEYIGYLVSHGRRRRAKITAPGLTMFCRDARAHARTRPTAAGAACPTALPAK